MDCKIEVTESGCCFFQDQCKEKLTVLS